MAHQLTRTYPQHPFDHQKWIDANESPKGATVRYCMVHDLEKRYKLVGMTKDELTALLGTNYSHASGSKKSLCYYLGCVRMVNTWICFHMAGDKVSRYTMFCEPID